VFTLVPAIDLTDGRLGAYTPEGPRAVDAFGGDASMAARVYIDAGARMLHVVDMDRAFTGEATNEAVVSAIHTAHPDVAVQGSGGVRDRATAERVLSSGAARVVMGSAALGDEGALARTIADLGDRVVIGIEVAEGRIRPRGMDPVDLELMETLGWLTGAGASGFVVTALTRVGSSDGPDVALVKRVARSGVPTMAAGGIASLEHLTALHAAGAAGAIVGHAALSGSLDLREAFAWAKEH
jgi:phosphoribosylanthranilate isomerase